MSKQVYRSEIISQFLNFLSDCEKEYNYNFDMVNQEDKLTQDFLHVLELEKTSYQERSKLGTALAKNRKNRRHYKDIVEETEPIISFLNDPNNKKTIEKMKQLLGQVRKSEKYHSSRTYKIKVVDKDKMLN